MIQDYNNLATSLGLLNTEKDAKAEVVAKKKEENASDKAKNKATNIADEIKSVRSCSRGFIKSFSRKETSPAFLTYLLPVCMTSSIISFNRRLLTYQR